MYLSFNGVRDFFTESELNVAFRDYGEEPWEKFYDPIGNSFTDLDTMFRSDLITRPIYYEYDLSLSASKLYSNFASWSNILPRDYDPTLYETCFQYLPRRVVYSLQQQEGLKRDNWRNYLQNGNEAITKYKEALALAKRLGDGMERQDSYRSGQVRYPVR
jgi:hypothetical protein